jgi:hypothetical protein
VDPVIGFPLRHPVEPPVVGLGRVLLEVAENEEQAVLRCRQRRVGVGDVGAVLAPLALQRPLSHVRAEGHLKRAGQRSDFFHRQAG